MPRVGGKIGRRTADVPAPPAPDGFSRVDCREITNFVAADDADSYDSLKAFAREAVAHRQGLVNVYHVADIRTRIEIPADKPSYQRIDAAETLALLRELPDPRLIHRLHLSDEAAVLDPWMRKLTGRDFYSLGHATFANLVVLYLARPPPWPRTGHHAATRVAASGDVQFGQLVRRFKRADKIETRPPLASYSCRSAIR